MKSVEATTVLQDILGKKEALNAEAGRTIAEFVKSKGETGSTDKLHVDLIKMLSGFSPEDQAKILAIALEYSARNMGNVKKSEKAKHEGGSFKGGSSDSRSSGSRFGGWGY